jgi:uncharacterized protein YkwD
VVSATLGLTLVGCQLGTDETASSSIAAIATPQSPTTGVPADPAPEVVAPLGEPATTTTAAPVPSTTAAPPPAPAPEPEPQPEPEPEPEPAPRKVRVAAAPPARAPAETAPAPTPPIDSAAAADFTGRTNALRASVGLGPLVRDGSLDGLAVEWAAELASSGQLRHSTIPKTVVGRPWSTVGENVGFGPNVATVHDALVKSAGHYANLTGAGFSRVGIGVAIDGNGRVWVVEVFAG